MGGGVVYVRPKVNECYGGFGVRRARLAPQVGENDDDIYACRSDPMRPILLTPLQS
jgi:hypothetical protein